MCAYYGAVNIFQFLISNSSKMTPFTLSLSFYGSNEDIINQCLRYYTPTQDCMLYAIISHNFDHVSLLVQRYNLVIDPFICMNFNNLRCYLERIKSINDLQTEFLDYRAFPLEDLAINCLENSINILPRETSDLIFYLGLQNSAKVDKIIQYVYAPGEEPTLFNAAKVKNPAFAQHLISMGQNVNAVNKDGFTPLQICIINKNTEVANLLIEHGADINYKNQDDDTPIHIAAKSNAVEIAKILIEKGAKLDEVNKLRQTPLKAAIFNKSSEIVDLLLKHGAKDDMSSIGLTTDQNANNIQTLVQYSESYSNPETTSSLVKAGLDVNARNILQESPLCDAISRGSIDNIKNLIELGADVKATYVYDDTILHVFASKVKKNIEEIFQILVDAGADVNIPNRHGETPLHHAVISNKFDVVKVFIENGAQIDVKSSAGINPLQIAANLGYFDIFEYLIDNGADHNVIFEPSNDTLLHLTAHYFKYSEKLLFPKYNKKGSFNIAWKLIDLGLDVNAINNESKTPLLYASEFGEYELVKLLIDKGADINPFDNLGNNAIHYCAMAPQSDKLQYLLRQNIDVNLKSTTTGRTPLHFAAEGLSDKNITLLIKNGANPNEKDFQGLTPLDVLIRFSGLNENMHRKADKPGSNSFLALAKNGADLNEIHFKKGITLLHWASYKGLDEVVKYLVSRGFSVNSKDSSGFSPIIHANGGFQLKTVKLLQQLGAQDSIPLHSKKEFYHLIEELYNDVF
ncbi:hypothetical protein TVAG_314970 [Trichomonas vaginalis G3]|uniref:DUF3447 domain-containing protein n=1 Tax=Trichomonas vaginalis (strain ATCC PRA-98 / G3) TaxID=412133 RepID=A2ETT6_TRIV3|nr:spectrin binding [Trichomonas vaginalis G3]EAY03967.1 hypothetical protein TVAG_314970 [Trichomonas vaginalis G3]KAI5541015.1 spectrin binding [Trichomonas vaginalis G3]|eukprot:XP_001316190.1 hypothetical protein [Trichomonas vaginalis G3]